MRKAAWELAYDQWKKELDKLVDEAGKPIPIYMWAVFKAGRESVLKYLPPVSRQYP